MSWTCLSTYNAFNESTRVCALWLRPKSCIAWAGGLPGLWGDEGEWAERLGAAPWAVRVAQRVPRAPRRCPVGRSLNGSRTQCEKRAKQALPPPTRAPTAHTVEVYTFYHAAVRAPQCIPLP